MSVIRFIKAYLRITTLLSIPLILGILWLTRFHGCERASPDTVKGLQSRSEMTVSDFQLNRAELMEKYPTLLNLKNSANMSDENTVKFLNVAMSLSAEYLNKEGAAETMSREELLSHANQTLEKAKEIDWPTYLQEVNQRIQKTNNFIEGRADREAEIESFAARTKTDKDYILSLIDRLNNVQEGLRELDTSVNGALQGITDWKASQDPLEEGETFLDAPEISGNPHGPLVRQDPLNETAPEELKFLSNPKPISALVTPEISASALPWNNLLMTSLRHWERDFFDQYPNVMSVTIFTTDEFNQVFQREEDRQLLREEQQEMLGDVTQRMRALIESNTQVSPAEKLYITRNILSQYWGSNFADQVVNELEYNGYDHFENC